MNAIRNPAELIAGDQSSRSLLSVKNVEAYLSDGVIHLCVTQTI